MGLKHLDVLMDRSGGWAKMVHVHVDQFNSPDEIETTGHRQNVRARYAWQSCGYS
ncbi:hypothetical protein PT276_10520 [Orbaceae bacterium ESL0721]|nr:hypothetical protein [Orbaceae bacterium ESL0721]